jgi:hypothetical protein
MAKALFAKVFGKKDEKPVTGDPAKRLQDGLNELEKSLDAAAKAGRLTVALEPALVAPVKQKYGFAVLEIRNTDDGIVVHGEINPRDDRKKKLRAAKQISAVKAAIAKGRPQVIDPEVMLTPEQQDVVERAQNFYNELHRKEASIGDGSTAYIIVAEALAGGLGNPAAPLIGTTLHLIKGRESITHLTSVLAEANLPTVAKQRIEDGIRKLQQALDFADAHAAGTAKRPPSWYKD